MGITGPAKNRSALQAAKGAHHSTLAQNEIQVKPSWPKMPKGMTKRAAKYWDHFCEQVDQHGQVLLPSYAELVEQICEVYAAIQYLKQRRVNGDVGVMTPREQQLIQTFFRLNKEFGNTPITLTRVAAVGSPKVGAQGNGKGSPKARHRDDDARTDQAQTGAPGSGFAGE